MSNITTGGGAAFPQIDTEAATTATQIGESGQEYGRVYSYGGMSLRDYFAAHVQADDRLVKCVRAMDDSALEVFALHPTLERDEHITEVDLTNWMALPSEVAKVARRLELEARAIARVRYMQSDAMLSERAK